MADPSYDDLRYFLAVAEAGSTLGASKALRVSQSTVARRIVALEAALGVELFHKRRDGYALTETGRPLVEPARRAEQAMRAFFNTALAQRRELYGTVRLTTNEAFANRFMPELVTGLQAAHPGIRIELVTSDRRLDLAAGEADIALRAGGRPNEAGLFGRKITDDRWSLYCSRAYAAARGAPRSVAELKDHALVGIDPQMTGHAFIEWMHGHFPETAIVIRQNTISGAWASMRSGLAVALVPDFLARNDPEVVHCFTPEIGPPAEIWLLCHEARRNLPRVRAVFGFLSAYFARHLAGD